jgi:cell division protein FtsB
MDDNLVNEFVYALTMTAFKHKDDTIESLKAENERLRQEIERLKNVL